MSKDQLKNNIRGMEKRKRRILSSISMIIIKRTHAEPNEKTLQAQTNCGVKFMVDYEIMIWRAIRGWQKIENEDL